MTPKPKVRQIPMPGSSGETPTGAIQFQNDWPGLFIRGDQAISLLSNIRGLEQRLADHPDPVVAAAMIKLRAIADIIERDVVVRSSGT
jgi:hypothetical protein